MRYKVRERERMRTTENDDTETVIERVTEKRELKRKGTQIKNETVMQKMIS